MIDSQAARDRIMKKVMDAFAEAKRSEGEGLEDRVTILVTLADVQMLPMSTALTVTSDQPNKTGVTRLVALTAEYSERMVIGDRRPLLEEPTDRGHSR